MPVLSFVGYQLAEKVGTSAIAATAIASSLVLAEIMFRWIEQPAIALGKWLVARAVLASAE